MITNKKRNVILLVLFLGVLMGALDIAIVGPALPAIQKYFGVSNERQMAWVFGIYVLFNLIGTPLMAKLSDSYGRRMIYVLDVSLFALGSLLLVLSGFVGFRGLLLGRAIQGLGASGIFPVASAVIGDTFPPAKQGSALGLIGAVFGLAFIVGPILGGVLLPVGWQWLFLVNIPLALVVIGLSLWLLPQTKRQAPLSFDWAGMAVLGLALASLAIGLNRIDTGAFWQSLISWSVGPFLLLAILGVVAGARLEQRAKNPILPPRLFAKKQLNLSYLLGIGAGMGEASLVFMPSLAVVSLFGVGESQASYLLMPVVVAMAFGSPLVGRLLDRFGSKWVILSGTGILTAGLALLSLASQSLAMFISSGALIGLGLSALLGAPLRYIMLNEAGQAEKSAAQGVVSLFTSVGQLVGSALIGAVIASGNGTAQGYQEGFLAMAGSSLVMFIISFALKSRQEERFAHASRSIQAEQPGTDL